MIDASQIKEHYSRMTDDEITHLAMTEGKDITPEVLNILHDEFLNRGLNMSVFGTIDNTKADQRKLNIEKAQDGAAGEFIKSIWVYAFDEKKNGTPNAEILNGLMERGLDETHSALIIKTLESRAKEILDAYDTDMLRGGIICVVGLVITVFTFISASNGGSYLVAWGAIIFGAIRFFRGVSNKEKYKIIIANIQAENEMQITSATD